MTIGLYNSNSFNLNNYKNNNNGAFKPDPLHPCVGLSIFAIGRHLTGWPRSFCVDRNTTTSQWNAVDISGKRFFVRYSGCILRLFKNRSESTSVKSTHRVISESGNGVEYFCRNRQYIYIVDVIWRTKQRYHPTTLSGFTGEWSRIFPGPIFPPSFFEFR